MTMVVEDLLTVFKAYKNVEEGGVVVVVQHFFFQLLLDSTVYLQDEADGWNCSSELGPNDRVGSADQPAFCHSWWNEEHFMFFLLISISFLPGSTNSSVFQAVNWCFLWKLHACGHRKPPWRHAVHPTACESADKVNKNEEKQKRKSILHARVGQQFV